MARSRIATAIEATRAEQYLRALNQFVEIYRGEDAPSLDTAQMTAGLSFFGLCIALVQKKYKPAIDLCNRAIELQFYNGDHYENLTRVYLAAGNRKRALETAELGLKISPEHDGLIAIREELGVRSALPVPFLARSNPINVSIGRARYARKRPKE